MRRSTWKPSIVPNSGDQRVYLVLDDLGRNGRVWPETDDETTDLETVIGDLLSGQYKDPIRVICFNTAEGWSQDVPADVAHQRASAAICNCETFRSSCRISSTDTKGDITTSSFHYQFGWLDHETTAGHR